MQYLESVGLGADNIQGHSVNGEPNEPVVAVSGLGGHRFDLVRVFTTNNRTGRNRFRLRSVIGSKILTRIQGLGCAQVA